jgi:hypothetical protein
MSAFLPIRTRQRQRQRLSHAEKEVLDEGASAKAAQSGIYTDHLYQDGRLGVVLGPPRH